jgi:hypothetical protein
MNADGSIDTMAEVCKGTKMECLEAQTSQLVESVPSTMATLLAASEFQPRGGGGSSGGSSGRIGKLHGAIIIYCGGMMMRVGPRMHEVARHIGTSVGDDCPWMGIHTFGEQGPAKTVHRDQTLPTSQQGAQPSVHGNLMFNCLLFGARGSDHETV